MDRADPAPHVSTMPISAWRGLAVPAVLLLAVAAGCLLMLMTASGYWLFVGAQFWAFTIVVLSLNLLFGYADQIVLAEAAIVGLGAYAFAIGVRHDINPLLAALIAVTFTVVAALVVALPALRLQGLYLGIATLALQFGASGVFESWQSVTGGQQGLALDSIRTHEFGSLSGDQFWFLVSSITAVVIIVALFRLIRGSGGRALAALRMAPPAAASLGADYLRWRLFVFAISGGLAGIAGVLFTCQAAFVSPASYSVDQTLLFFLAVIVGGVASVPGSVLGALLAVVLPQVLSNLGYSQYQGLIFAAIVVVMLLLLPRGLVTVPSRLVEARAGAGKLLRSRRASTAGG